jgi:hypothetical protein
MLWSKQREILESVRDHQRTAVHSCHGAGKSAVAAMAAGWWIDTHPPGSARVATSAPSTHQVEAILWFEIHRLDAAIRDLVRQRKEGLPLPGRLNLTSWWIGGLEVGFGRKPADQDVLDQFQGIHADEGVLVILDEAGGIPAELWEAAGKIMTSPEDRMLVIGNPDYEGSHFSKVCSDPTWNVVHIDGLETPNFTGEEPPPKAQLISQEFVDRTIHDYGKESPQYVAQVRGRFPKDRTDGVIPWSWLSRCRGAAAGEKLGPLRVPVELGIDVAASEEGTGGDETVIWPRFGVRAGDGRSVDDGGDVRRLRTQDTERIVDVVISTIRETDAVAVKVDWSGMGIGLFNSLTRRCAAEVDWPVEVIDVRFAARAGDEAQFVNQRAEMWWMGRLLSRNVGWDLTDVDQATLGQLAEPRWFEAKTGRIQIEEKDQVRKRLGRSPDDADALLLAFYNPPRSTAVAEALAVVDDRFGGRRRR